MIALRLLDRLDGVRAVGPGRWVARCPAHEDKSPSLSVRETADRLLVHDFAGCQVHDVLVAVGLQPADLFPPRTGKGHGGLPAVRPIPAHDILIALGSEISFLVICASDMAKGETLTPTAAERLWLAHSRFRAALQAGEIR